MVFCSASYIRHYLQHYGADNHIYFPIIYNRRRNVFIYYLTNSEYHHMSGLIVDTAMFFLFLSLPSYLLNNIVIITLHCFFFYAYVTWFSYFCENEAHLNRKPVHLEMTSLYDSSFERWLPWTESLFWDGLFEQKGHLGIAYFNRKFTWRCIFWT